MAYVDMEYILEQVASYRDAEDALNEKAMKWQTAIELKCPVEGRRGFSIRASCTCTVNHQCREEDIRFLESEIAAEQQEKFGPKDEYMLQQELLIQPIQDQVLRRYKR